MVPGLPVRQQFSYLGTGHHPGMLLCSTVEGRNVVGRMNGWGSASHRPGWGLLRNGP